MDPSSNKQENVKKKSDCIRNFCIMAHVDHGKTTLADSLIATNGIISENQAGTVKYMDSRPDEMARGITMKSSCITLAYTHASQSYLINLIDSPGHVDFSSEVSTAVRLCDGCVLVVDVVEGVCAQTKAVMRQAWAASVKPVLVLNKLDRLILEKELQPIDAYYHIISVLEQVNAYMAELYNMDVLGRTNLKASSEQASISSSGGKSITEYGIEDVDDSELYFNPSAGNVVFASAIDGWGFSVSHFAEQFSKKLGMSLDALSQTLWGDYYITNKNGQKRVMKGARDKRKNPLFVTLVLENLYEVYRKVRPATAYIEDVKRIAESLNIKLPSRLYQTTTEHKARFSYICSNWLPLSKAVIEMVIEKLPSPAAITEEKARKLLTTATQDFQALPPQTRSLITDIQNCTSTDDAPLIVYVSKMFGVTRKKLREANEKLYSNNAAPPPSSVREQAGSRKVSNSPHDEIEEDVLHEDVADAEELLAFARIFSGSLKPGQEVYVLGPKHSPADVLHHLSPDGHLSEEHLKVSPYISKCKIDNVYLLMGREVQCLKVAGPGLMVGISGLTDHIIKSASLSSTPLCPPFTHVINSSALAVGGGMSASDGPMLRVQVLPKNPRHLSKLRDGLKLLNQADPCVQVWLESTGEYMVGAAGEVHLQRCLSDLEERYACTPVHASDPIIPFRETIVPPPSVDNVNEAILKENIDSQEQENNESVYQDTAIGSIQMKAVPLPPLVTDLLFKHSALLRAATFAATDKTHISLNTSAMHSNSNLSSLATKMDGECSKEIKLEDNQETGLSNNPFNMQMLDYSLVPKTLSDEDKIALDELKQALDDAFKKAGPEWEGATDCMWTVGPDYAGPNILFNRIPEYKRPSMWHSTATLPKNSLSAMDHAFVSGFQLCTAAGSLCEEPLMGVGIIVEDWCPPPPTDTFLPPGRIIALSKDLMTSAINEQPRRMMVSMYSCVVTVTSEAVGNVYNVLGRRHGRVIHGDITEGSTSWNVTAYLPIVESINFANELRKATSGEAQPQLVFSHWETLDIDPYWEPSTADELEHYGEKADSANLGLYYMNMVRRRKGIKEHGKKIVEMGEKQRTLTKNK